MLQSDPAVSDWKLLQECKFSMNKFSSPGCLGAGELWPKVRKTNKKPNPKKQWQLVCCSCSFYRLHPKEKLGLFIMSINLVPQEARSPTIKPLNFLNNPFILPFYCFLGSTPCSSTPDPRMLWRFYLFLYISFSIQSAFGEVIRFLMSLHLNKEILSKADYSPCCGL